MTNRNWNNRIELDSHADTCVLGPTFIKLFDTGQRVSVSPFISSYNQIKDIPIVTAATAIQHHSTGETIILIINQGLWFGDSPDMDHSLINPNQLRHHGVLVNDNPYGEQPMAIKAERTIIPLISQGTTIYFNSIKPTDTDLRTRTHIHLTSDAPWIPSEVSFPARDHRELEVAAIQSEINRTDGHPTTEEGLRKISAIYDPVAFAQRSIQQMGTLNDIPKRRTFISGDRHSMVSDKDLSERWHIGLKQAQQTIKTTTQRGIRSALLPMARRYKADRMFFQRRLKQKFFTDTMFMNYKSLDGNKAAQVFANQSFFVQAYPMASKAMAGQALGEFINDYGIMTELISDGAREQVAPNSLMMQKIRKYDIKHTTTEPHRHNQNRAEGVIRELKRKWYRTMMRHKVPKRLWDYGIRWCCDIMNRTSNSVYSLKGRTPLEELTGETPDISEYLDFGFYDYVLVHENAGLGEQILCRWLGVSHRVGSQMTYFVIKENGKVLSRGSVQRVTNLELATKDMKRKCKQLDDGIEERLDDSANRLACIQR